MTAALSQARETLEPEWRVTPERVEYPAAVAAMEARVEAIRRGEAGELVWLLEHPPLYTAGTSARAEDLLSPAFPLYHSGRGGQLTYHGPGQRVAYVLLDLRRRGPDLRRFVRDLEEWIIRALSHLGVVGERRAGRVGIWVLRGDGTEAKIAAIGIRVRQWITFHGVAVNRDPDLSHYSGIVPCGLRDAGVTSLKDLGLSVTAEELDSALEAAFREVFGQPSSQARARDG